MIPSIIRAVAKHLPAVLPYLRGTALYIALTGDEPPVVKTVEYYLAQMRGLIRAVYNNILGGEFIDIMANLISGQLWQAANQALTEAGVQASDEIREAVEAAILSEYDHVDGLYRDIVDARIDGTPIDPLLDRAHMWANRWNDVYNIVKMMIAVEHGDKLEWVYGDAEHCDTCRNLHGIVAFASEWEQMNVRPQAAPNSALDCGGWRCKCSLVTTDKRRSPKALTQILNAVTKV